MPTSLDALTARAASFFSDTRAAHGVHEPLPGVLLLRHGETTPTKPDMYEPVMCLILQGRKITSVGDLTVRVGPGESLLVSHDIPVVSRITRATPTEPYLAIIVTLDIALLRGLYEEVADTLPAFEAQGATAAVMQAHRADAPLIDTLLRMLATVHSPLDRKVLLPLLQKELHYRLLLAPHGEMLRRLLRHDSYASHVSRAVALIRSKYREAVAVDELARAVGMSTSSLHKHFKRITSTTPLQFQKELRLLEARRLLTAGRPTVSTVAYEVGYESPNQFSREYARMFGVTPGSERAPHAT